MTTSERLALLKANLQLLTNANDALLTHMLSQGQAAMSREGIINDASADYEACVIDYAAYLFRKRASTTSGGRESETAMPRFLRWQLNNLLFSQKAAEE